MELARRLRPSTDAIARRDYDRLNAPTHTEHSRAGLKLLDHFFLHHRLNARIKHRCFAEAMTDPAQMEFLTGLVRRYRKSVAIDDSDALLKQQYAMFQLYYGTVNQFRRTVARALIRRFASVGVLDFSAGWGGRALAAMSLGVPYTGIDSNINLRPSYRAMTAFVKPLKSRITMVYKPAELVDFSAWSYDMVFTSPPYFTLEEYEHMPEYGSKEAFLTRFFRPVVASAWEHLLPGGYMVLNMPDAMEAAVVDLLPPLHAMLPLAKRNRHAGMGFAAAAEWVFVWKKE